MHWFDVCKCYVNNQMTSNKKISMQKSFSTVLVTEKGVEFSALCMTESFILYQTHHHWGSGFQQEETGCQTISEMPCSLQWRDCHHQHLQPQFLSHPPVAPSLFLQCDYRPLVLNGTAAPLPGMVLKGQLWDRQRGRSGTESALKREHFRGK